MTQQNKHTGYDTSKYEVTEDGQVMLLMCRGRAQRTPLAQWKDHDGYLQVRLVTGEKKKFHTVHSLVALRFLGPRPAGMQVRHLDGNKTNNHKSNLAYGTAKENARDREMHGRTSRGMKHSSIIKSSKQWQNYWSTSTKQTPIKQFTKDGVFIQQFKSMRAASRETGTAIGSIHFHLTGRYKTASGFIWKRTTK